MSQNQQPATSTWRQIPYGEVTPQGIAGVDFGGPGVAGIPAQSLAAAWSRAPQNRSSPAPGSTVNTQVLTSPMSRSQSPGFRMQPGANPIQQAMSQYQSNLRAQVPQQYQQYLPANFGF